MKNKIKDIISHSDVPVYDLGAVVAELHGQELMRFLDALVALVHQGDDKEKFVALNVLSVADSVNKEKLVGQVIQEISVENDHGILTPIIRMIQEEQMNQYAEFCIRVFQYAKDTSNERLLVACFRCLLRLEWRRVLDEVSDLFRIVDDVRIVDTLAFFRSVHDEQQYAMLLDALGGDCQRRIKRMNDDIDRRLKEHYLANRKK